MDDPYAILRIPALSARKEKDLPKLKERAIHLVREYQKANKHNKADDVMKAYRQVKEMIMKTTHSAGAQAFSKVMINKSAKRKPDASKSGSSSKPGGKNPAEAHFLKAQGSAKDATSAPKAAQVEVVQCSAPGKSREERLKEKLEARREAKKAEAGDKDARAAAIREKLAAKRAKKNPGAEASPEAPLTQNMASPDTEGGEPSPPPDAEAGDDGEDTLFGLPAELAGPSPEEGSEEAEDMAAGEAAGDAAKADEDEAEEPPEAAVDFF